MMTNRLCIYKSLTEHFSVLVFKFSVFKHYFEICKEPSDVPTKMPLATKIPEKYG